MLLNFIVIQVNKFLSKVSEFIRAITLLVNDVLASSRLRQKQDVNVLIIEGSVQELDNGKVQVVFLVHTRIDGIVMAATIVQAITSNATIIAEAVSTVIIVMTSFCFKVGASGINSVTEGVPSDLLSRSPTELSDGDVVGIVFGILLLLIVALSIVAVAAWNLAKRGKSAKYIVHQTDVPVYYEVKEDDHEANPEEAIVNKLQRQTVTEDETLM